MQLLLFCLLPLLPCPGSAKTLMQALATSFDIITFTNFLHDTHLDKVLNTGHHILFVPTDSAFNKLPQNYMTMLHDTRNPHTKHLLPDLVKYHIVPYTGQLNTHWTGNKMNTLLKKPIRVFTGNKTVVNGVVMTDSHLTASNGHIYLVDEVLTPPQYDIYTSLIKDDRFSTFLSVVFLAGMGNKLKEDKITVFAPTNTAFQYADHNKTKSLLNNHNSLQAFVHYYVLPDLYYTRAVSKTEELRVPDEHCFLPHLHFNPDLLANVRLWPGSVPISQADWLATNGVIQVMERVVMPNVICRNWHSNGR